MPSVAISTTATAALVAAVTGKRIRVHGYVIQAAGTVNVKFQSASTDLTGAMPQAANTGVATQFAKDGWFDTAAGEALNIHLSGSVQVSGHLRYSVVG